MDAPFDCVCAPCLAGLREPSWPRCERCHFPRGTGRAPSSGCLECADWPEALAGARTAAILEPPASQLVHALKYGGWRGLAHPMGQRMARLSPPADRIVVPVPTTAARARRRGYNQAALLASAYAEAAGASCLDALVRVREGPSQVALAPDRRKANVDGAFEVLDAARSRLRGREVALVDDVLTTGATGGAAARALERGGARRVIVVSFARALPGRTLDV